MGHAADPLDVRCDAEPVRQRVQLGHVLGVPARADNDQVVPRQVGLGGGERAQQPVAVLVRPQRRDEEHERPVDPVTQSQPTSSLGRVARAEQVVVDGLGDEPELSRVHVEVLLDLGAQALGVDDDGVRHLRRPGVADPPVQPGCRADRLGSGERVHRLEVRDERRRGLDQWRDQGAEHVDPADGKTHRRVHMLAERPQVPALVRPREGDVPDPVPVAPMSGLGPAADHEVQLLALGEELHHLGDDPRPEPVGARRMVRVVREQVDGDAHGFRTPPPQCHRSA